MRSTQNVELEVTDENICATFNELVLTVEAEVSAKCIYDSVGGVDGHPGQSWKAYEEHDVEWPIQLIGDDFAQVMDRASLEEKIGKARVATLIDDLISVSDDDNFVDDDSTDDHDEWDDHDEE